MLNVNRFAGISLSALFCAAASFFVPVSANAQSNFPDKEIRLIVPWNAGGSNDISARALSSILAEKGVKVVVENVPGATGSIGMTRVARANPDGYTVGMGTSSTLALIAQNLTPLKNSEFASIARVTTDPLLLLVPYNSPVKNLEDFVAYVKKNPGKVSIGTPGSNNLNHIFALMAGRIAGAEVIVTPYTGGSRVIADLSGGQINAAVLKPSESKAQIDGKLVRAIGVFANEPLKEMPNVPTFKSKGYDVFPYGPLVQMAYLVAPANTPKPVMDKLISLFGEAIQSDRFKKLATEGSALVDNMTGSALDKEVASVTAALVEVGQKVFAGQKK